MGVGNKVLPPLVSKEDVKGGSRARQCSAGFVEDSENIITLVEEMFPISSDSVPEEEIVSIMRSCPLMLTAFQRNRGI